MDTAEHTWVIAAICNACRKPFEAKVFSIDIGGKVTRLQVGICAACEQRMRDEEVERDKRRNSLEAERVKQQREAAWAWLCPVEFRLKTESDGQTDLARLELSQPKLKDVLAWQWGARGLIVRGETRRCKTRAVWRLIRRLWVEGRSVMAMTAGQFDRQCRDAGGTFTLTEWFNRLARTQVFFIDDLGKANWSPATEATWFDLVDERTREHRPILITTNDDGDSLAARMSDNRGEPLVRRLQEFCDCVVF